MTLKRALAYFSDEDQASYAKALRQLGQFSNSVIVDFGKDFEKWHDGDGAAKERYGIRPANWVPIYKFTAVYGNGVDENLRWLSDVGSEDNFGGTVTDTIYDAMTDIAGGPWALMNEQNFLLFGGNLGIGQGQQYRLRPDGVWIKVAG